MPGATSPLPRWERVRACPGLEPGVRVKQLDKPAYPTVIPAYPPVIPAKAGTQRSGHSPLSCNEGGAGAKRQRGMPTATITPARKRHSLAPPRHSRAPSRHSRAGGNLPSATSPLPRWDVCETAFDRRFRRRSGASVLGSARFRGGEGGFRRVFLRSDARKGARVRCGPTPAPGGPTARPSGRCCTPCF